LEKTVKVFDSDNNVGGVVRSYYWFSYDKNCPIRITKQNNEEHDVKINIADNFEKLKYVFDNEILGQLSGLAFRMKYIDHDFSLEPWISHGYPMVSILKKHSVVFLEGNYLAVRVGMNATRIKSPLYDKSPMLRWIELYEEVFKENKFKKIKQKVIKDVVAVNYVGLIQIKNFGKFSSLLRECWYLIKYRSLNIFSIKYWFFAIGTIVIPSSLLLPMVDFYKDKIISRSIGKCR
ncbi:MAG: hypothetical protein OEY89_18285, partial [Gammaproteobacteria bacterium]|nr:hypothetical protein [Gammaproteobacteria bacterium]